MAEQALNLKFTCLNCNGLGDETKRATVINRLKNRGNDIFALVDTRFSKNVQDEIKKTEPYECIFAGESSTSKGIAIFKNPRADINILSYDCDRGGQYLIAELAVEKNPLLLAIVYGPSNEDDPAWWRDVYDKITSYNYLDVCIMGDFNIVLDTTMDQTNYVTNTRPNSTDLLNTWIENEELFDAFRLLYPEKKVYSWFQFKDANNMANRKMSRIDHVFTSPSFISYISKIDYEVSFLPNLDHGPVVLSYNYKEFTKGKGFYRAPAYLIKDKKYLLKMKEAVLNTVIDHLESDADKVRARDMGLEDILDMPSSANPSTLFEVIIGGCKLATQDYVASKNRERIERDKAIDNLLKKAGDAATKYPNDAEKQKALFEAQTKAKLHFTTREEERALNDKNNWILNGDKASSWYLNLVKNRSAASNIPKLIEPAVDQAGNPIVNADGTQLKVETCKQEEILQKVGEHFTKVFAKKETSCTISEFLNDNGNSLAPNFAKISNESREALERNLTTDELSLALSKMKNGSSPGVDGFGASWVKVMWIHLKKAFFNSVQHSKETGLMSPTFRHGLITLLPKGDKDRTNIGNWRPITLLSVFYKLISASFAKRLRDVLPEIIHFSQKAYLKTRYIGAVVKNTYDKIHFCKHRDIEGMILLIDFSKAFDSIEHSYIESAMEAFGFGPTFRSWIALLLKQRFSQVVMAGHPTPVIELERGVPQGDPISAYLFLIAVEILSVKIRSSTKIKGIKINGIESKIDFYADDLTATLLRTEQNVREMFKILNSFKCVSGLAVNLTKTAVMFIGPNQDAPPLCPDLGLEWPGSFKLLGIIFTKALMQMSENYERPLAQIKAEAEKWIYRMPTTIARADILKTSLMSKLTHFPIVLPHPTNAFFNNLKKTFNNFIWGGASKQNCL